MNKSKSKKLILGILLCICLVICAVLFAFANSKGSTVYAADDEPTLKLEHGNVKYAYTGGGNDTKYGNTSCTVATFPYGSFNYSGSLASTSPSDKGASYSVGESSKDYKYKGAYEAFTIKVTMPAGKKYRIKFTFDFSSSKNQTNGQSTSRTRAEVFYFGEKEDKSASLNFAIAHSGGVAPGNSSSYTVGYCQSTGSTVSTVTGSGETAITYDNSQNGSSKEFTSYFGFYAYAGGSLNIHTKLSASWSYSYKVMHNPVDVPTIKAEFISVSGSTYKYEAKYTGAKQTFTYNNLNATYITANYNSLSVNKVDSSDEVTFSLVGSDCFWNDEKGGTGVRYLEVTVVRGDPKVVVDKVKTCKNELPDEVPLNKEKSQSGTATWFPGRYEPDEVTGELIEVEPPASIENPKWVFVPEDSKNYTEAIGVATVDNSHTFPEENHVEKVDATCTQGGNIEYWQCSVCEKYFSDSEGNTEISLQEVSVDALGHNMTEVAAEEATCTEDGNYKYYSCSRCDGLFWDNAGNSACTEEEVFEEKLGHNTTDTVVDPTCTSRGYTTHTCTREGCDYSYDDTYTNMSPHAWDEGKETTAATCTATGVKTYTCTVCNTTKTEQIEELGHTSEDIEAVAATCTSKGKTAGTKCSVCNAVLTAPEDTDALGHDFSITVSGTQPTCQHGGTATMKCSRCDETQTQDSADPVDHVFTNYVSNNDATCTVNGTKTAECDFGCGTTDTVEDEDSATGHSFTEYESDNNATCIEDGTKTATCDNGCGTTDTIDDTDSAFGHDFTDYVSDGNATCLEDGTKTATCNNGCGETDTVDDEGSALGHDFADYISDSNATCTEDGTKTAQCSRGCGEKDTVTDEGSALGHDFDWVITLMPTEEEEGLKENLCKRGCGAKDGEEVIAKLVVDDNGSVADLPTGHDYDLEIAVKESDSLYNIEGITKGYKVELFVVDGDNRIEYDSSKTVTLMLVIPEGMEDNFALYCRHGDILETVDPASYTVSGRSVTIRTTLPNEYVFNAPAPEEPASGIPWWVWVIIGLGGATLLTIIIVFIVVAKKKKGDNTPTDNGEVIQRLDNQDQVLNELLNRGDDGGFNTPVELDENGNVIFK